MRTIYIAEDGTEFDNEHDCIDYEESQRLHIQSLCSAFNFYHNGRWQIANNIANLQEMLYSILSSHLKLERNITEKEADYLHEEFGYDGPTEEGLYRYTKDDMWVEFEDEFNGFCTDYPMFTFNYKNAG